MEQQTIEVHSRTIELGVNLATNMLGQMGMSGVEGVIVMGHALAHLEQKFGLKYVDLIGNFKRDKKLDLVPPET